MIAQSACCYSLDIIDGFAVVIINNRTEKDVEKSMICNAESKS